jgi:hypothetical protein
MTPTGMLGPVLLDSLLLLNRETCVLTGDETTEIMRVVEEIGSSFRKSDYFTDIRLDDGDGDCKADDLWIDEQLHLLRFACARNLARVSI